jgi:CTP synthase (UTP-ammonia lyase)
MGAGQLQGHPHRRRRQGRHDAAGAYDANLSAGSRVAEVYGTTAIEERHRHRYEVDIKYRDALEGRG